MFRPRLLLRQLPKPCRRKHTNHQYQHFSTHHLPIPPTHPLLQSRLRFKYVWYTAVLFFGLFYSYPFVNILLPGTRADESMLERLARRADGLPLVKSLRNQCYDLHEDISLEPQEEVLKRAGRNQRQGWMELDTRKNFVEARGEEEEGERKEVGGNSIGGLWDSLGGTRGLRFQRAFWNADTKEFVAVVWVGLGLGGWPWIVHGGAIATVFEDAMARMVAEPEKSIDIKHRPSSMSFTYIRRTTCARFYILRASIDKPQFPPWVQLPQPEDAQTESELSSLPYNKDPTKKEKSTIEQPLSITGTLESTEGDLLVKVKGTFAVDG